MSLLTLEHIKINELPPTCEKVANDQEAYLNDLHSQGIDLKRLRESIQQLETGEVETVKLDDLDAQLDDFIENANTKTHTQC